MKKFITAIAALVLSGCAMPLQGNVTTFHADYTFNDTYRSCIEKSADNWREATGGAADIKVKYDLNSDSPINRLDHILDHKIVRLVSTEGEGLDIETRHAPFTVFGQTHNNIHSSGPVRITLIEDKIGQDQHMCRLTVMHEFGHAFGLQHATAEQDEHYWHKTDIMYPAIFYARTECLKSRDLAQFCLMNDCSQSIMSCESQPDSEF